MNPPADTPGAMQLRTLQTIDGLGPQASNTVVLAVPIEVMELAQRVNESLGSNGRGAFPGPRVERFRVRRANDEPSKENHHASIQCHHAGRRACDPRRAAVAGQWQRRRTRCQKRTARAIEPGIAAPALLLLDAAPTAARQQTTAPEGAKSQSQRVPIRPISRTMHVSLEVLVDGRPLRTVKHEGKTYLPVPKLGTEYALRVWNHGPRRISAVLSVDGLSAINGQPASAEQPGYVVAPYSHIVIKGWRRNMDAVAAFRFVDRERSYAAKMGRPENIGVIGLIAIEELAWQPSPVLEQRAKAPNALRAAGQVGSIGTEYGREIDSHIYYVPFLRSGNWQASTIYYDTVAALRAAGVPVDVPSVVPFPADPQFAPPPPGYRGK